MTGPFDPAFEELPAELPLFPLTGVLLLPGGTLPLNIFEPRYLRMVEHALGAGRLIGMVQPMAVGRSGLSVPDGTDLYRTGCAGRIVAFEETGDGRYVLRLRGVCRFAVGDELPLLHGFRRAHVDFAPYRADLSAAGEKLGDRTRLMGLLKAYFELENIDADWDTVTQTPDDRLVTTLAMVCPFEAADKQALLESADLERRAKLIIALIEDALRRDDDNGGAGSSAVN